jgi:transcriptional regulator with XRE-family HTH domain
MTGNNAVGTGGGEPESSDSLKSFGAIVKVFRERAGLTQDELAPLVRYSTQTVASIEQGRRLPPPDFVERAESALDAFGALRAGARHLGRRPGLASWFRQWARLESEAITLHAYECRLIPGLLQCEAYARAAFQSNLPPLSDGKVEEQTAARMERQLLLSESAHVAFNFIIEQVLLERCTGGVEVTRMQIAHLLACAELRNVELQVMPTRQEWHAGLDGPLYLAETQENQWFGYFEGQRGSYFIPDRKEVSVLLQRYGKMRSQALSHQESVSLLERMRGTL